MARQRKVYVIEFKSGNGRKWHEADCEIHLSNAKEKLKHFLISCPDDHWRIKEYFPRD